MEIKEDKKNPTETYLNKEIKKGAHRERRCSHSLRGNTRRLTFHILESLGAWDFEILASSQNQS